MSIWVKKKTAGNVYLAVCIEFNKEGNVEKLVRPPYPWMALNKENHDMEFTSGQATGLRECKKCLYIFCGIEPEQNWGDNEKEECCKCSKKLNEIMDAEKKKKKYPASAEFKC